MHHGTITDLLVARLRGKTPTPESDWSIITSTSGLPGFTDVFWSPNGELLYYVSIVNGQETLMTQRLDRNHRPTGAPFLLYYFSGRVRPGQANVWWERDRLNAVPGRIIGTMKESNSNIWLMDLPP
jgi:hypothetical protein